ncbi:MAG: type IX secretion system membrane protein PorP/SprF, partial [Elusimicrobiota bacterium]|nr:type IX secretion system membrane protein PorP/SprF [Elusimicrobiota bacterium]
MSLKIKFLTFFIFVAELFSAFREVNYTAKSAGLACAYVAVCEGIDSLVFNPAGMAKTNFSEVNFTHSKLFYGLEDVDLQTNLFGYIYPVKNIGSFGLLVDNFLSHNYKEYVVGLYYARRIVENISLGLGVKYLLHQYILDKRTETDPVFLNSKEKGDYTVDFGLITTVRDVELGCSFKNLTQPDVGLKTKDIVPMQVRIGIKYIFNELIFSRNLNFSLDIWYRMQEWGDTQEKFNLAGGVEIPVSHYLLCRAGMNLSEVALGFGFRLPEVYRINFKLDYAFLFPLELKSTSGTHRLSFGMEFG